MLPPEFRDTLHSRSPDGRLVLTTYDGCVVGLPLSEWQETEIRLSRMKNASRKVRDFRRLVLGGAEEVKMDAHGRIRVTREQMLYAGIEQEAVIVGQGQSFEIWSPSRLDAVLAQDFDDVAEEIADTGIDFGF